MMTVPALGIADPALSAQANFRAIMAAMARPGTAHVLRAPASAPQRLSRGAAAVALALCDQDTPVWLDAALAETDVADWLRFHTGAPIVSETGRAAFAFLAEPQHTPPFEAFALGTTEYPDRSATLVLQVESLEDGPVLALTGPGIKGRGALCARPLPQNFAHRLAENRVLFPRGVDLLLVTDRAVAALPRSVQIADEP
ncbi:MAG: phosphonate C-P lyase system protein PhnH [Xanthobacteraceae bacterium]